MADILIIDMEQFIIFGFMFLVALAGVVWLLRQRGKGYRYMTIKYITEDRRLIIKKLRIHYAYLIPDNDMIAQAWHMDGDAISINRKTGDASMLCGEDSAVPYYLGTGISREERAKALQDKSVTIATMEHDRAEMNIQSKAKDDIYAGVIQIVVLGSFCLLGFVIIAWALSSNISIHMPW